MSIYRKTIERLAYTTVFVVFLVFTTSVTAAQSSSGSSSGSGGEFALQETSTMTSLGTQIEGFQGLEDLGSAGFIGREAPENFIGRGSNDSGTSRSSTGTSQSRGGSSTSRVSSNRSRTTSARTTSNRSSMSSRSSMGGYGSSGTSVIQSLISFASEDEMDARSTYFTQGTQNQARAITSRLQQTRYGQMPISVEIDGNTAILRGVVRTEKDKRLLRQYLLLEPGISYVEIELLSAEELRQRESSEEDE